MRDRAAGISLIYSENPFNRKADIPIRTSYFDESVSEEEEMHWPKQRFCTMSSKVNTNYNWKTTKARWMTNPDEMMFPSKDSSPLLESNEFYLPMMNENKFNSSIAKLTFKGKSFKQKDVFSPKKIYPQNVVRLHQRSLHSSNLGSPNMGPLFVQGHAENGKKAPISSNNYMTKWKTPFHKNGKVGVLKYGSWKSILNNNVLENQTRGYFKNKEKLGKRSSLSKAPDSWN
jgi:hypothetical protein